jgi:hypothetical protein
MAGLTNIANQQTTTQKRDTTTTIGKASNLKGKNITLDIDASEVIANKANAQWTYKKHIPAQ